MSITASEISSHLVLGGARSGKSSYAERLVTRFPAPYIYLATAEVFDEEMRERVLKHQERRGADWQTIETPLDLTGTLRDLRLLKRAVLLDCLTLWLSNLLLHGNSMNHETRIDELCSCIQTLNYPLVIVSNEVGTGIVPENALARRFRDLAGFANQRIAALCSSVTLVVAGIPLRLK